MIIVSVFDYCRSHFTCANVYEAWVLERDFSQLYRHEHTLNIFTNKYILIKININVQVKRVNIN